MGFYAQALGVSDSDMTCVGTPSMLPSYAKDLFPEWTFALGQLFNNAGGCTADPYVEETAPGFRCDSRVIEDLMIANDHEIGRRVSDPSSRPDSEASREAKITALFATQGVEVEFIN